MELGIKGKVALVAAASKGLGFSVARELAREGADLVICSRGTEDLLRARDALVSENSTRVHAVAADLSVRSDIGRLVTEATDRFGRIDILVTNSGGPPAGGFEDVNAADWADAVQGLLMSVVELSRLTLPGMKERRWGRILNITSIAVKQPVDNLMLSNSVRAAVTGFARTLANEVAPFGITVNNLLPGYTATERVEDLAAALASRDSVAVDEIRARWESEIPMKRLGHPEEFAALAAFVASERAGYITGTSIPVDGGWIRSLI